MSTKQESPSKATTGILRVTEVFGPTFQGEGPSMGRVSSFLRLAGCNLACKWCDTPYAIGPHPEHDLIRIEHLVPAIRKLGPRRLVITGGEPLLQQEVLRELILALRVDTVDWVEIETNGTIVPDNLFGLVDQYNVSPKLRNSGHNLFRRYGDTLRKFMWPFKGHFKFVVQTLGDFDEVDALVKAVGITSDRVWVMPEGITSEAIQERLQIIAEAALCRQYNLTTRLQVQLWGNIRRR